MYSYPPPGFDRVSLAVRTPKYRPSMAIQLEIGGMAAAQTPHRTGDTYDNL